jgi:hypothetical protein
MNDAKEYSDCKCEIIKMLLQIFQFADDLIGDGDVVILL